MGMTVLQWRSLYADEMSMESITRRHEASYRFGLTEHCYQPGERVKGLARAGVCYLLNGACQFTMQGEDVLLQGQQVLEFPAGEYLLKVLSSSAVNLIFVWPIGEHSPR